ncbi:unnamed protein product [Trichogramma brassicae]|uniref:Uncharacterized protein n=1 Tax=Trichogramma brassicae TaxID=86971 RepID=A0A6H5I6N1_9HYME|nr:unnamed protein product [Trichogramma brassicae]
MIMDTVYPVTAHGPNERRKPTVETSGLISKTLGLTPSTPILDIEQVETFIYIYDITRAREIRARRKLACARISRTHAWLDAVASLIERGIGKFTILSSRRAKNECIYAVYALGHDTETPCARPAKCNARLKGCFSYVRVAARRSSCIYRALLCIHYTYLYTLYIIHELSNGPTTLSVIGVQPIDDSLALSICIHIERQALDFLD